MFICNHAGLAGSEVVADIKRLDVTIAFALSSYLRVKVKSIAGAGVSETI